MAPRTARLVCIGERDCNKNGPVGWESVWIVGTGTFKKIKQEIRNARNRHIVGL